MIYFLRHFKVNDSSKNWLNSDEFDNWVKDYDTFELEYSHVILPRNIDKIYVSSQNRAIKSADFLNLDYEINDLLVEVPIKSFINTKFKLPKWLWLFAGRVSWFLNFKQNETKKETNKRVEYFIQNLDMTGNILIISHGFLMMLLVKKLKKIGYTGIGEQEKYHRMFVDKMKEFKREMETGEVLLSVKIIDFLKDWLVSHIVNIDTKYSGFANTHGIK